MATIKHTLERNPLQHLKLENNRKIIKGLTVFHVFRTEWSPDEISKAIAFAYPELPVDIGGNDVKAIFAYLEANSDDYARFKAMAACDRYGDRIPEIQATFKDWDVWVGLANPK